MQKNTAITIAAITLVVGGLIGYYIANAGNPFSRDYMQGSTTMMRDNGGAMMQMGQIMMSGGQMMQQKGQQYNNSEMMQKGKEMDQNGQMMQSS